MRNLFLIIVLLCLVGCKTVDTTIDTTIKVITVPIKTVETIGKAGSRTITNYYSTLEELNEGDLTDDEIILYMKEF